MELTKKSYLANQNILKKEESKREKNTKIFYDKNKHDGVVSFSHKKTENINGSISNCSIAASQISCLANII